MWKCSHTDQQLQQKESCKHACNDRFKYTHVLNTVFLGPEKWAENFPLANGPRQSPINIVPKETQYDPSLKALKLKYDPSNAKGILNNGHSFQVDFVDDTDSSSKCSSPSTVRDIEPQRTHLFVYATLMHL